MDKVRCVLWCVQCAVSLGLVWYGWCWVLDSSGYLLLLSSIVECIDSLQSTNQAEVEIGSSSAPTHQFTVDAST